MSGYLDFHTHILFDVDHGVQDLETMKSLIDEYAKNGFDAIAMTPHIYHPMVTTKTGNIRENFQIAKDIAKEHGINAYLGSELYVLAQESLNSIPINGKYALMEFPVSSRPLLMEKRIEDVTKRGLVPVIAHIERYEWVNYKSSDIQVFQQLGCLIQANVADIEKGMVNDYLKNDLIDIIASDNHGDFSLPCRLAKCLSDYPEVLFKMQYLGL